MNYLTSIFHLLMCYFFLIFPDTYAEATKKLKSLESEDHVFTLDSDEEFDTKAKEIECQVRKKLLLKQSKTLTEALTNCPRFDQDVKDPLKKNEGNLKRHLVASSPCSLPKMRRIDESVRVQTKSVSSWSSSECASEGKKSLNIFFQ